MHHHAILLIFTLSLLSTPSNSQNFTTTPIFNTTTPFFNYSDFVFDTIINNYYATNPSYGDEQWWLNYSSLFSATSGYTELSCSGAQSYNDYAVLTDPKIYRFEKTARDRSKYSILEVTTCCYSKEYYFDEDVDTPDLYCDEISLDSVLYLLTYDIDQLQNKEVQVLDLVDDDDLNICNDTYKSTLDLSSYPAGEYFIGLTGWYGWPGYYHIELDCIEFDYPPIAAQLQSHATLNHVGKISCDQILYNQENTRDTTISYYNFSIDENTETPAIISTCNPLNESSDVSLYETHLYLIRESGASTKIYTQIDSIEDSYDCDDNRYAAQFDISSLIENKQYGTYYIGVGGEGNLLGRFSLSFECGVDPEPKDYTELIIIIVVISVLALGLLICCCCFYCRQLKAYKEQRRTMEQLAADEKAEPMFHKRKSKPDEIELQAIGSDGDEDNRDIKGRRLTEGDIDENPDMDMVVAVMRDIIQACEDEDGLDIYQVLAFRKNDMNSHQLKLVQPMKKWGCNCDILQFSAYNRAWFVAVVVFLLQVIGITVILFSVTVAKWDEDELGCAWTFNDWIYKNNWMFKILAFLWALVITLNIGSAVTQMQLSGFNQVIERIDVEKYTSFDIVDVSLIELGYMINLYTLLVAVFGSYFIVFTSKGGADAIDMVLNAVALFFMIELDDMLVTHEDYEDVGEGAQEFLKHYVDRNSVMDDGKSVEISKQACSEGNLTRLTTCVDHFGFFIRFIAIVGGLFAPIWIVICYDGVHD